MKLLCVALLVECIVLVFAGVWFVFHNSHTLFFYNERFGIQGLFTSTSDEFEQHRVPSKRELRLAILCGLIAVGIGLIGISRAAFHLATP